MTREIKFRAWDKENKIYFRECDWLSFKPNGIRFMWTDYEKDEQMVTDLPTKDYILMQYTNLKDKNGKEIYEGDVVISESFLNDNLNLKKFYKIVEWDFKECGWNIRNSNRDKTKIIIGNIYENPDLIK